jgi:hypothetical protein
MGCCYSKKLKEYDEIISSGTERMVERFAEKLDMFAATYNGQSYTWKKEDNNTGRSLNE